MSGPSQTKGQFLLPETTVHSNGEGPPIALEGQVESLLVTLGITKIVEQEALTVSIQSSPDGTAWAPNPLASFPQKFYTGMSSLVLELAKHPDVRHLRVQWKVVRWGRGEKTPSFTFYLFAEPIPSLKPVD